MNGSLIHFPTDCYPPQHLGHLPFTIYHLPFSRLWISSICMYSNYETTSKSLLAIYKNCPMYSQVLPAWLSLRLLPKSMHNYGTEFTHVDRSLLYTFPAVSVRSDHSSFSSWTPGNSPIHPSQSFLCNERRISVSVHFKGLEKILRMTSAFCWLRVTLLSANWDFVYHFIANFESILW